LGESLDLGWHLALGDEFERESTVLCPLREANLRGEIDVALNVAFVVALETALGNQRRDVPIEIWRRHGCCLGDERPCKTYDDQLPQKGDPGCSSFFTFMHFEVFYFCYYNRHQKNHVTRMNAEVGAD
jgi:hypothetical protein